MVERVPWLVLALLLLAWLGVWWMTRHDSDDGDPDSKYW